MTYMLTYHCLEINSGCEYDNDCDDAEKNCQCCGDNCANSQTVTTTTSRQRFKTSHVSSTLISFTLITGYKQFVIESKKD